MMALLGKPFVAITQEPDMASTTLIAALDTNTAAAQANTTAQAETVKAITALDTDVKAMTAACVSVIVALVGMEGIKANPGIPEPRT